jgi:hypothetical protein
MEYYCGGAEYIPEEERRYAGNAGNAANAASGEAAIQESLG